MKRNSLIPIGILITFIFILSQVPEVGPTEKLNITSHNSLNSHQLTVEQQIKKDYDKTLHPLNHPFIIHDPYENSPLSYLALFETKQPAKISVSIQGKQEGATLTYESDDYKLSHELVLVGLYPNTLNDVLLTATYEDGTTEEAAFEIQTKPITPASISVNVTTHQSDETSASFYLINDDQYYYLIDSFGEIRWIQNSTSGSLLLLKNGNLLTYNKPYFYYYQAMLQEIDFLGKVHETYYIPGAGHHSLYELANGDLLINSSDKTPEKFIEDQIFILDRQTGLIKEDINLRDYLDPSRFVGSLPQYVNESNNDWYHLNYAMMDEYDQTIIASGRSQSMVVKLDPVQQTIKWILGPHDEVSEELQSHLLTPIGENFSWPFAQHSAKVIDDLDQNPDTTDVILFDNHVDIGVFPRNNYPDLNQYSRGVHYRIDEVNLTVEQLWDFGKSLGPTAYSTIISEIDYIKDDHTFLTLFGFVQSNELTGGRLYEVSANDSNDILFSMDLLGEGANHLYTAQKITLDDLNLKADLNISQINVHGSQNLNVYKESATRLKTFESSLLSSDALSEINLIDEVLTLRGYIPLSSGDHKLSLVLTASDKTNYLFEIHPFDISLTK
ncbi:MAG: aryl-sulfate sulfotransferase, partial [Turicibacter sp.]